MTTATGKRNQATRTKPSRNFPLYHHRTGQWAKKIRGRTIYFGADVDAALRKYLEQKDDLQAGRTPRIQGDGLTVQDLCNRFLTSKTLLVDSGELHQLTFREYYATCERICTMFGKTRLVSDLASDDFDRLRAEYSKTRGLVGVADAVRNVRIVFKFAYDNNLIQQPMRWGSFKAPARSKLRRERQAKPRRMFEAAELRSLIDAANQPIKAMILLGINCGFGQSDIARLPQTAIEAGWVNFPRVKTAVERRCPLWPETIVALQEAATERPTPTDAAHADLVFLTRYGVPFVRCNPTGTPIDSVGLEFGKLLRKLNLKRPGLNFYALRHTFETIAGESRDQVAVDCVMGHAPHSNDMAAVYRERISDERLVAVVEGVRKWLSGHTTSVS